MLGCIESAIGGWILIVLITMESKAMVEAILQQKLRLLPLLKNETGRTASLENPMKLDFNILLLLHTRKNKMLVRSIDYYSTSYHGNEAYLKKLLPSYV